MSNKVAITQSETSAAIDQIAQELMEAHAEASVTLRRNEGNTGHPAYRVQAGKVKGIRSALATLEAYLEISPAATKALDFVDHNQLPMV